MVSRDDIGSWLEGHSGSTEKSDLGLPESGPGSLAPLGLRAIALIVDWGLCLAISVAFFDNHPMATLGIFAVSTFILVSTLGTTIGHRLTGIRVVRLNNHRLSDPPGFISGLARTVLLCLVIPPAVWDADGRGLHDKAAGTAIIKLR